MMGQYLRFDNPELLFLYHSIDYLRDFHAKHPYVLPGLGFVLVGVGIVLVFPAVGAPVLGAVGFCSGGVAAGSLFLLKASLLDIN